VNDRSRTPLQSARRARHTGFWERLHRGAAVINQRAHSETEICDRIIVRGRLVSRCRRKRADYLLVYEGVPLGVIEAKDNTHAMGDGLQQALAYAERLNTPFVFASNGDGFVFHDRTGQTEQRETSLALDAFPSPEELWRRYRCHLMSRGRLRSEQLLRSSHCCSDQGGRELENCRWGTCGASALRP
jgi:type I site-specific restriction endonuclease